MGLFVVLEGPEGSGKTTQGQILCERLQSAGYSTIFTQEPGGTQLGEKIRQILKHDGDIAPPAELLLFVASRAQLVAQVIEPHLSKGDIVICDRFSPSTLAYQGYGRGLALDLVKNAIRLATGNLQPDLLIFLDFPIAQGLARKGAAYDRFEKESLAFHLRVQAGYRALIARDPEKWLIVDATLSMQDIHRAIWERVETLLKD
ncbi:MAG: dTMP kinase [Chloroflexi bacterium]|nr:dTMP kinase [Chloroflexota bacterium]